MGLGATEDSEQRRDLRGSGALRRSLAAVRELWGGGGGTVLVHVGGGGRWTQWSCGGGKNWQVVGRFSR